MAFTGSGLRVPRGPVGFLAGLIGGLEPSMPAIREAQKRRRAAAKKNTPKPGLGISTLPSKDEGPADGPTAEDYAAEYSWGGEPPPSGPTNIEGLIEPSDGSVARPARAAAPEARFFSDYLQGTVGSLRRALRVPPSGREGAVVLRGYPAGRKGAGTSGMAPSLSDRQRYASHLRKLGADEALVRRMTSERYPA